MEKNHLELMERADTLAKELGALCLEKGVRLATAESLTAGMIASTIVNVPGSSQWFDRGFIVYNNDAKREMLGVRDEVLEMFTEVSGPCVLHMAQGALERSGAHLAVAVSGIAGPDGGDEKNPVGTVWMAAGNKVAIQTDRFVFSGDRLEVRLRTTVAALEKLISEIRILSSQGLLKL